MKNSPVIFVLLLFSLFLNVFLLQDVLLRPDTVKSTNIIPLASKTSIPDKTNDISVSSQTPSVTEPERTFLDMSRVLVKEIEAFSGAYEFPLSKAGVGYIQRMLTQKRAPALLSEEKFSEGLCAGYLYELTSLLRGEDAPRFCGMLEPRSRQPADAWELPYSYRWRGGSIPFELSKEIGEQIKATPDAYPELIDAQILEAFFRAAFNPHHFFGDVGFLYRGTRSLRHIGMYGNYNSHITKNIGISSFSLIINDEHESAFQQLQTALDCDDFMRPHILPLLTQYERKKNEESIWLGSDGFRRSATGKVSFEKNDVVSFDDVTVVHFFNGPRVDSLLQLSCQGEFYPVNVLQINPIFLEPYVPML